MAPVASSSKLQAKPYDRPSAKGKGKAPANASLSVKSATETGAPAQHSQRTRKGKKAWRKNVDISQEETAMEQAREEERVTGGRLSEKKTGDLFTVDTTGDVEVAKKLRRASKPLRSLAILDERSAIPSLTSKPVALAPRKTKISAAEKARLRKIARRDVNIEEGAPISSADLKASSIATKDAWEEEAPKVVPKGGFGEETMVKKTVKAPKTITEQRQNYLNNQVEMAKGLELPSEGTSYNPSAQSHAQLMQSALEEEKLRLAKEEADAARIAVLGEAINARRTRLPGVEYAAGMVVGPGEVDDEDESADDGAEDKVTKQKRRKTQAQRNKALRAKEAARLASLEKTQKRLAKSIGGLSTLEKDMKKRADAMAEAERLAKLVKKEKERMGLVGGEKIGKHRLAKSTVNVQLGEDLAESLRQVKPEGNLFKDRFLALQKKAFIEPRFPQLPKKKNRTKEYEKHAYKRFV